MSALSRLIVVVALVGALGQRAVRAEGLDDPDVEVARKHFVLGSERYAAGDYLGALAEFELAKRARPVAALDFNIARCLDRLERYGEAVAAYRQYVTAAPNAPDAATVRERIVVLEARVPSKPIPPPTQPPVTAPPPTTTTTIATAPQPAQPSRPNRYLVPGILTGVTGVTLITGAALLGVLDKKYDAANAEGGCRPCTDAQIAPLERYRAAGLAMMGISGALLVVDVALFVVAAKKK